MATIGLIRGPDASWGAPRSDHRTGALRVLGEFPAPAGSGEDRIVYVDSRRRRAYYMYNKFSEGGLLRIAEYDISKTIPRFLRGGDLGVSNTNEYPPPSPYAWTLDTKRQRLLFLHPTVDKHSVVGVLDVRGLAPIPPPEGGWDFNDPARLPGLVALGLTYSPADDRIYIIGHMVYSEDAAGSLSTFGGPAQPVVVIALDPADGSLVWARPVPECQQALYEQFKGSLIARSRMQDALYFACVTNAPPGGVASNNPGYAGVVRLEIDPQGSSAEALGFRADFFAISGSYQASGFNGVAAFDPHTDQFFLQSLSAATPGAWVFDGRLLGWAGFIAAPERETKGYPKFFGINPRTGQYYIGSDGVYEDTGYVVITNDRALPIPQGNVYEGFRSDWFLYADEASNRIFVPRNNKGVWRWLVVEDLSPAFLSPDGADFDSLTSDVDEGPGTEVTFVSGLSGYGAKATVVGGYGGASSGLIDPKFAQENGLSDVSRGRLRPADRSIVLSGVPSLDLRSGTASAAAQAASLDPDSDSDLGAARTSVRSEQISPIVAAQTRDLGVLLGDQTPEWFQDALSAVADALEQNVGPRESMTPVPEAREAVASKLLWPWEGRTCLDGGDQKVQEEAKASGGSVSITCDAASLSAVAKAAWGHFAEGPVSIASTSFDSRGWRDPKTGANTLITAAADGIKIALDGIGTLRIGHMESTVATLARGRPGTSKATWTSAIEQVRVLDAAGEPVAVPQACDDHASCQKLATDVTHALTGRIRLYVPEAHVESTKKGAFATVEKRFEDFLNDSTVNNDQSRAVPALQIEIYRDGVERSRLLLQFAAIQADSIYTISPRLEPPPIEPPSILPDEGIVPGRVNLGEPVGGGTDGSSSAPHTGGIGGIPGVLALLVRSPLEALHAAGVWLLFGAAVFGVARRRMFHERLSRGDG